MTESHASVVDTRPGAIGVEDMEEDDEDETSSTATVACTFSPSSLPLPPPPPPTPWQPPLTLCIDTGGIG